MFHGIIPPDAPANEKPLPFLAKPVDRIASPAIAQKLVDAGFRTIADLKRVLDREGPKGLTKVPGVGPGTVKKIQDAFELESKIQEK